MPVLTPVSVLLQLDENADPAPSPVRIGIRVLLGVLVLLLLAYIVVEQVGTWKRRRRSGRD